RGQGLRHGRRRRGGIQVQRLIQASDPPTCASVPDTGHSRNIAGMNGALSKGRAKVPPARTGRLDSTDRRYEPFVRLVPAPVRRVASSWRWDAPDGGAWDLHIEH